MPQVINTNIASLNAQRNLNASQGEANTALERLSSGLRINSAKDDAAGLAISERFQSQISGLIMAQRNANDGISLAQTAEGAMDEITNNLQRIRELAVQSANATNSNSDRQALNQEVQQRIEEINRIAAQTSFNGLKVLNGTFGTQTFQVGANTGETIGVSGLDSRGSQIGAVVAQTSGLGETILDTTAIETRTGTLGLDYTTDINGAITINGEEVDFDFTGAADIDDFATALNTAIDTAAGSNPNLAGIDIDVAGTSTDSLIFTNNAGEPVELEFNVYDSSGAGTNANISPTETVTTGNTSAASLDLAPLDFTNGAIGTLNIGGTSIDFRIPENAGDTEIKSAIDNAITDAGITGVTANITGTDLAISNSSGGDITFNSLSITDRSTTPDNAFKESLIVEEADEQTLSERLDSGQATTFTIDLNGEQFQVENATSLNDIVSQVNAKSQKTGIQANLNRQNNDIIFSSNFDTNFTVSITADVNADGTDDITSVVNATPGNNTTSMVDIDISDADGADLAMIAVDYAIDTINGFRAELGAVQNRFESTIANLATTSENLSASNSRIRDADFAAESAELARTQVLQQAGLSVLAQANARPQQVLQLLQG